MQRDKEAEFVDEEDEEDDCLGFSDEREEEEQKQSDLTFKSLSKNEIQFFNQVNELNEASIVKIRQQKYKEAILILQKAEKMLEFAASCGRAIDRNLIIVVLYNEACAYQCQWVLDKCSKYIDGVIYNLELSIKEEQAEILQSTSHQDSASRDRDIQSLTVKSIFIVLCNFKLVGKVFDNILIKNGRHKAALENAKKAAQTMRELFKVSFEFCKEWKRKNDMPQSNNSTQTGSSNKGQRAFSQKSSQARNSNSKQENDSSNSENSTTKRPPIYVIKDEVAFAKLVIDQAYDVLQEMSLQESLENMSISEKEQFNEAKRQLYYWRNNPENNEKHLRKELKVPQAPRDDEFRSLLGVQNVQEWIENFNIGSIMHMVPLQYDDFHSYGEMIYEISKRILLEKVIYLSISYFTIATEFRFIEIEKAKLQGITDKDIRTEEFKLSELYHLKAIEIACKHITCSSPYINHLITSYHKHYNQNLDIIPEESFHSTVEAQSEISYRQEKQMKLKQVQAQTQKENMHILNQYQSEQKEKEQKQLPPTVPPQQPQQQKQQILPPSDPIQIKNEMNYTPNTGKQVQNNSPTSKLMQSVVNKPQSTKDIVTPRNNLILEQMLRGVSNKETQQSNKNQIKKNLGIGQNQIKELNNHSLLNNEQIKYLIPNSLMNQTNPQSNGILNQSPGKSASKTKIQNGKREQSPSNKNQNIPALSFIQNALINSKQHQQQQQQHNFSSEQETSITYKHNSCRNNLTQQGIYKHQNLIKIDISSSQLTIQPQPFSQLSQIYGSNPKSSRNPLNNLLSLGRPSSHQQPKQIEQSIRNLQHNLTEDGYFSYRQPSGPNGQTNDNCRTERSTDAYSPLHKLTLHQLQSRSPSREDPNRSKPRPLSRDKKAQTQQSYRGPQKPRISSNYAQLAQRGEFDKSAQMQDMSIPMRLETIQQLLKSNGQLINFSKTNLAEKKRRQ